MCDYCSWIEKLLRPPRIEARPTICTNIIDDGSSKDKEKIEKFDPTILVHGTANSISSRAKMNILLERIETAAIEAYRELNKGAESVDSVELAIRTLEGEKSAQNSEENVNKSEGNKISFIRDAAIMDSDFNVGSVGAVTNNDHPITLAKKVLQNTDHVLIVESGIKNLKTETEVLCTSDESSNEKFAGDSIPSKTIKDDLTKIENVDELVAKPQKNTTEGIQIYGALARDRKGRLACGISTYDDRGESIERSTMSATGTVIGCGIFADDRSCCSVSSNDKSIYLYAPARKIVSRLKREVSTKRDNNSAAVWIDQVLKDELKNFIEATEEFSVGAAALSIEGEARVAFESRYFPWACCNLGVITSGCIRDEVFSKVVQNLDVALDCECH